MPILPMHDLAVHQFKKHNIRPAVSCYADPSNACLVCLLHFPNRQLMCKHLQHSYLCLLNAVLRVPPMHAYTEAQVREREQICKLSMLRSGFSQHKIVFPSFRLSGPRLPCIAHDGTIVQVSEKRHPRGPGKQLRLPPDGAQFVVPV